MKFTTLEKCCLAFFVIALISTDLYAYNVHPIMDECESETAFAFLNDDDDPSTADDGSTCFIPQFNRWGWTTLLDFSSETGQPSYELDIYSGAGQCDLSKGTDVGSVVITYNIDNTITFNYNLDGYVLSEAHIYIGDTPYPTNNSGAETVAPGQYTFTDSGFDEVENYEVTLPADGTEFYIIVHGVTKGADCPEDPDDDCPDSDEDGVCDDDDICPGFDDGLDSDGDGIPDGCDDDDCPDSDGDGVCDADDLCPGQDDTIDYNDNGIPDGCENIGGIDQVDEINIFPVPFDAEINIRYKFNYDTKIKIELFDMKGVQLLKVENINYIKGTTGQSKLNLSEMSNQLLLLNLSTSQGQFTKKIISN
ncbi:MAG: hypothetical protein HKN54_11185 [Flavobacteriaceae bacterium]|nr:hypothetical protein [Flavobacteriaceae bacterium]